MEIHEKKFETARTRQLRAGTLNENELKFVAHIEEFGCQILTVDGGVSEYRWAYAFGIYDACGKPELITVGLDISTGYAALNRAANALRAGVDLTVGRHSDIVGKVDVVFRPADAVWVKQLMNSAKWFNGGWDFPVLQMIYPDLQNRFQWDDGFDEEFHQPLLQEGMLETRVESDFRASIDPTSSLYDWKFPVGPHTNAYLSKTVNDGDEAVTYVSHDADDGAWQFLGDSMSDGGGPVLVCLHHPIDKDSTLKELADLPRGWYAEREAMGEPWIRCERGPEEEEE